MISLSIGAMAKKTSNVYVYTAYPTVYKLGGNVIQGGEGISAVVLAFSCATGDLRGETVSNPDGTFEILQIPYLEELDVVFINPLTGTKEDVIHRTLPVLYTEVE